tara:strand:+ start:78 stop:443 length:366 start_codon:yes stop_codon:yes gene_type:complete
MHSDPTESHLRIKTRGMERAAVSIEGLAGANGAATHGEAGPIYVDAASVLVFTCGLARIDLHVNQHDVTFVSCPDATPRLSAAAPRNGATEHLQHDRVAVAPHHEATGMLLRMAPQDLAVD